MAHPLHHTHGRSETSPPAKVAEVLTTAAGVSGQGDLRFRVLYTGSHLPEAALTILDGGFAVDRRPSRGETYFALPGAGLVEISGDLKSTRLLDTDESMKGNRRFFMYHEDVDLCWRFWILGYRVVTAPRSRVFHHFSASTREEQGRHWRELIGERNNIRALIKNYQLTQLLPALRGLMELPQPPQRKKEQWRNLGWNLLALPDTLWNRMRIQWRRTRSDRQIRHLIESGSGVPIETATFDQPRVKGSTSVSGTGH